MGLPHYPLCTEMFSGSVATGACSCSSAMDPIDSDDEQQKDDGYMGGSSQVNVESHFSMNLSDTPTPSVGPSILAGATSKQIKSTRCSIIDNALDVWTSVNNAKVHKMNSYATHNIESCMDILQKMEGIPAHIMVAAQDKFMSKMRRKIFLLQNESERNAWLESLTKMYSSESNDSYNSPNATESDSNWLGKLLAGHPDRIKNFIRLTKPAFIAICDLLMVRAFLRDTQNSQVSIKEAIAIFCLIVAQTKSQCIVAERLQHSLETISRHFKCVVKALVKLAPELIRPPDFSVIHPRILHNPQLCSYFRVSTQLRAEADPESDSDSENDEEHHPHASQQEIDAQSQFPDAMERDRAPLRDALSTEFAIRNVQQKMESMVYTKDNDFVYVSYDERFRIDCVYPNANRYYNEAPKHWESIKGIFREYPRQELPILETYKTAGEALDNPIVIPDTSTENSSPPCRILTRLTVRIRRNRPQVGRSRQLAPRDVPITMPNGDDQSHVGPIDSNQDAMNRQRRTRRLFSSRSDSTHSTAASHEVWPTLD
ncbi:hypothetical protein BUALT_Bualt05G0045700 [Buddleja alternifolia]|uniref:DUF8040 domain-containing protein n=1 Tax=Buddleja alternifolia TaxID=168488 RepID=A0AAV6XSZ6_9LAMI|nr:hypothetical protein BUALT_Bualt05G0045700 [Buddleja alternifolia]